MMKWHLRAELWVLLILILGGLGWVFTHRGGSGEVDDTPAGSTASTGDAPLQVLRCTVNRDGNHARLDIDVRVRNDDAAPLVLQTPTVKLLNAKGAELPSFFLPFDPPPQTPAHGSGDAQLRYWLDGVDFSGALTLQCAGHSAAVKSGKAYDLKTMPDSAKADFMPTQW